MQLTENSTTPAKPARYAQVNAQWPSDMPPITRPEAEKAVVRLYRKFGENHDVPNRSWVKPQVRYRQVGSNRVTTELRIRRCWVSVNPPHNRLSKGWRRLVHDASHRIARHLFPGKRPHDWRQEHLERDMVAYVLAQGWLSGALKAKEKPKADPATLRRARVLEGIARWEAKEKRARNALKKLRRQKAYYDRRAAP